MIYKRYFFINIWEIKRFITQNIADIQYINEATIDKEQIKRAIILDPNGNPEIKIRIGFKYDKELSVILDRDSKIYKEIEKEHARGFFGEVKRMSLCFHTEDQVIFTYKDKPAQTLFMMYPYKDCLYLIIVNSKREFDESILNIFNFSRQ